MTTSSIPFAELEKVHFAEDPVQVLARHGKSFSFAGWFFKKSRLKEVALLYSVCRYVDDCADELEKDQSIEAIEKIRQQVTDPNLSGELQRKINHLESQGVKREFLLELLNGAIFDVKGGEVTSRKDLLVYCYRVAGVVGLMMCPLIGVVDKKAYRHAVDLGIAMQLTNISRDILEDARNGRIYLPAESLQRTGMGLVCLSCSGDTPEKLKDNVKCLLDLADDFYESGFRGLAYIPLRPRIVIALAGRIYRAIGVKIRRKGYEVLHGRTYLGFFEKSLVALSSVFYIFRKRFWRPGNHDTSLHQSIHHLPGLSK